MNPLCIFKATKKSSEKTDEQSVFFHGTVGDISIYMEIWPPDEELTDEVVATLVRKNSNQWHSHGGTFREVMEWIKTQL